MEMFTYQYYRTAVLKYTPVASELRQIGIGSHNLYSTLFDIILKTRLHISA